MQVVPCPLPTFVLFSTTGNLQNLEHNMNILTAHYGRAVTELFHVVGVVSGMEGFVISDAFLQRFPCVYTAWTAGRFVWLYDPDVKNTTLQEEVAERALKRDLQAMEDLEKLKRELAESTARWNARLDALTAEVLHGSGLKQSPFSPPLLSVLMYCMVSFTVLILATLIFRNSHR